MFRDGSIRAARGDVGPSSASPTSVGGEPGFGVDSARGCSAADAAPASAARASAASRSASAARASAASRSAAAAASSTIDARFGCNTDAGAPMNVPRAGGLSWFLVSVAQSAASFAGARFASIPRQRQPAAMPSRPTDAYAYSGPNADRSSTVGSRGVRSG